MTKTETVTQILIILPIITGTLSLLCSSLMVIRLVRRRNPLLKKVKERLLLGLSMMDIAFSASSAASTFAGPTYLLGSGEDDDELYKLHAHFKLYGTRATCNLQGWLYQFGGGAIFYNAALCCYYYLVICHGLQDDRIRKTWYLEPLAHALIWVWSFVSASIVVGLDLVWFGGYNGCLGGVDARDSERCTVAPQLPDCQPTSFDQYAILGPLVFIPTLFAFICIIVLIVPIYWKVKKTETRAEKWKFNTRLQQQRHTTTVEGKMPTRPTKEGIDTICSDEEIHPDSYPLADMECSSKVCENCEQHQHQNHQHQLVATTSSLYTSAGTAEGGVVAEKNSSSGCMRSTLAKCHNFFSMTKRQKQQNGGLSSVVSETGVQYVVGFLVTYGPVMIQLIIARTGDYYLPLAFVVAVTLPMQGVWNWIFYTRGRLRTLRATRGRASNSAGSWKAQLYTIFFE